MEEVRLALSDSLLKEFGPGCTLEIDTTDRCVKIELPVSKFHVIYVRPDERELNFLCHYAHKEDLQALIYDANGDSLAWKQQNAAQLPLRVKGTFRIFVKATMWYARLAVQRIDLMKGLGGKRSDLPIVETFKEARSREYHYPEPKKSRALEFSDGKGDQKRKARQSGHQQEKVLKK